MQRMCKIKKAKSPRSCEPLELLDNLYRQGTDTMYMNKYIVSSRRQTFNRYGVFFALIFKEDDTMASIRKRGNSYQVTVSNGRRADGTQIIETNTYTPEPGMTKKQIEKKLNEFVVDFERAVKSGKYLDGEKITFEEFSERYMNEYAKQHIEKATLSQYETLLRIHVIPAIGNLRLAKIQPAQLNKFYLSLSEKRKDGHTGGYSAKTIKHFTLEQAEAFLESLNHPFQIQVKGHNRVDDTGKSYHVDSYIQKRNLPLQFKVFFYLALFCGLRRGELIALEWSDFDFKEKTVNISKSSSLVNGKVITKTPKTESSNRIISVPESVMQLVRLYRKKQVKLRLKLGDAWEGDNYVFVQWNGRQMYPSTPYGVFKDVIRRYNATVKDESKKLPDIPLHGLRHTSATLLISKNVDIRTVAGRLGHAQTSTTTDIYSHFLKRADTAASDTLEELLQGKKVVNISQ